jgi:hypothetical protein
MENFPEFKQAERNCTKHFNLIEAIRSRIADNNIYAVSELEQDLCNFQNDDKTNICSRIKQMIGDSKV